MRFQRVSWRVQQTGWLLMFLALLAALLGAFSNGVLSRVSAIGAGGALRVDYESVYRNERAAWIELTIAGRPGAAERRVVLAYDLLERLTLEGTEPAALRQESHPDGLHLLFALSPEGESRVRLTVRPHQSGGSGGTIGLDGEGAPAALDFLILP